MALTREMEGYIKSIDSKTVDAYYAVIMMGILFGPALGMRLLAAIAYYHMYYMCTGRIYNVPGLLSAIGLPIAYITYRTCEIPRLGYLSIIAMIACLWYMFSHDVFNIMQWPYPPLPCSLR
jgi:hypothetical protein